jgi:hypothetical protein
MAPEEVVDKYRILAGKVLPPQQVDALRQTAMALENAGDIRSLVSLLTHPSE